MMEELKGYLVAFKSITCSLIDCLAKDNYDDLDTLLNERQSIISNIEKLQYNGEEFVKIAEELEIDELQNNLNSQFIKKRIELVDNIKKISANRNVQNSYNNNASQDSFFFNKKL